jgi:hypothetical protein
VEGDRDHQGVLLHSEPRFVDGIKTVAFERNYG